MPGNGTFNLTALWRALGIKNPSPTIRETIQPVIQVADFSRLSPEHRPATGSYGGVITVGAAMTFTRIEITSRSPGGTLIPYINSGRASNVFQAAPDPALAASATVTPTAVWSRDTPASLMRTGTSLLVAPTDRMSMPLGVSQIPEFWLPPGVTAIIQNVTAAQNFSLFGIFLIDLPSADAPPD